MVTCMRLQKYNKYNLNVIENIVEEANIFNLYSFSYHAYKNKYMRELLILAALLSDIELFFFVNMTLTIHGITGCI